MTANRKREFSVTLDDVVDQIFSKKFTFSETENYVLPSSENCFIQELWQVKELQKFKAELNSIKENLSDFNIIDWHDHTSKRSVGKDIQWQIRRRLDPELLTQAWTKFNEILYSFSLVPTDKIQSNHNQFLSLHLCEAPGAFVTCLNRYLKTHFPKIDWDWVATTLNPYYEGNCPSAMINDDRFIAHTMKHWFFGTDNTGDLLKTDNLDALDEQLKDKGQVLLITADGSVNCIGDPSEQESIVAHLQFCEVVAAIRLLAKGGNFLLKIFTTFENSSVCLIYLLTCIFEKVHFHKPVSSKEGNSEVYIICQNFKGQESASNLLPVLRKHYENGSNLSMFREEDIPENFLKQIIACAKFFKDQQCEAIEKNMVSYFTKSKKKGVLNDDEKEIVKMVSQRYFKKCQLRPMDASLEIVGNEKLKSTPNISSWYLTESFNEEREKMQLKPSSQLLLYRGEINSELVRKLGDMIFQQNKTLPTVDIVTGKAYSKIRCSKFCTKRISKIFGLLVDVIASGKDLGDIFPSGVGVLEYDRKSLHKSNENRKIVKFQFTRIYDSKKIILWISEVLKDLKQGEDLILFGYQLFTQFNVGLLYLLTFSFEALKFDVNDLCGCTLILKKFWKNELVFRKIDEICTYLKSCNNHQVLSILPVLNLYDSEMYDLIVKVNPWILKFCLDQFAVSSQPL